MVEATRCNTSSVAIDSLRILEHGFDDAPGVAFEPLKKAAVTTGMTGDSALLFHDQQNGVVVAVEPDLAHPLSVTGALALAPQPPARVRSRSKPLLAPSRSMLVNRISPTPSSTSRRAHSTASRPVAVLPPCV